MRSGTKYRVIVADAEATAWSSLQYVLEKQGHEVVRQAMQKRMYTQERGPTLCFMRPPGMKERCLPLEDRTIRLNDVAYLDKRIQSAT